MIFCGLVHLYLYACSVPYLKEVLDPENPELMGDSLIKLTLFHGYSAQYIQHKVNKDDFISD